MPAAAPVKVSNKHNAIIDYLIANPEVKLGTVAAVFNLTPPWLSTLLHSSAFKAKLHARQEQVFNVEVCATVEERLMGVASVAADRLLELVPREGDVKVVTDAMDKTMKLLGYGQKVVGTAVQQNNTLVLNGGTVDAVTLNRARSLVGKKVEPLEGEEENLLPAPEEESLDNTESMGGSDLPQVSADRESEVGALDSITALFPEGTFSEPQIPEGLEVRGGSSLETSAEI